MVFGCGAAGAVAALGLVVVVCCRVVRMELLFLVKSFRCPLMNRLAEAIVMCFGAGCLDFCRLWGGRVPLALASSWCASDITLMESMTQV